MQDSLQMLKVDQYSTNLNWFLPLKTIDWNHSLPGGKLVSFLVTAMNQIVHFTIYESLLKFTYY